MLLNKKRPVYVFGILASTTLLLLGFQNCSGTQFNKDYASSVLIASVEGQGLFYTNDKTVKVDVFLKSQFLNQIRASIYSNMDAKNIPWKPWNSENKQLTVELLEQYASDGTKDGLKTIYLEAKDPTSGHIEKSTMQVFLDTQSPVIDGIKLLAEGPRGQTFNFGQQVSIQWNANDKIPATGQASGLDGKLGLRYGITYDGDCSESKLKNKTDWQPYNTNALLSWPVSSPLDNFYVCVFVKDKASNISNYLSQPMSSLWTVIAGDNSQGNGASVTSNKVRFKYPSFFSSDKNGNLQLVDLAFGVERVINSSYFDNSRTISSATYPTVSPHRIVTDSSGAKYYYSGDTIFSVVNGVTRPIVNGISGANVMMTVRQYLGVERLAVFFSYLNVTSTTGVSTIAELKTSDARAITNPINYTNFKSSNKIVGNDYSEANSEIIPDVVNLTANDPFEAKYTLGNNAYHVGFVAGADGSLYISSTTDGNSYYKGHPLVRRLLPTGEKKFTAITLGKLDWTQQLSYHKYVDKSGVEKEILLAARIGGAEVFDLKTNKLLKSLVEQDQKWIRGGLIIPNPAVSSSFDLYLGNSSTSQIYRYDENLNLIETLGRPIYNPNENIAISKVLGTPDGLYTDKVTGEIYILDSQFSQLYKLLPNGSISYIGQFNFKDFSLNGYVTRMDGDFSNGKKILYINSLQDIQKLDLATKQMTSILDQAPTSPDNRQRWGASSLKLVPQADGSLDLLSTRFYNVNSMEAWHASNTGFLSLFNLVNDQLSQSSVVFGDITKNTHNVASALGTVNNAQVVYTDHIRSNVEVDSTGNIYTSGRQLIISRKGDTSSRVLSTGFSGAFVVIEPTPTKRILINSDLQIIELDITNLNLAESSIVKSVKQLCLPGTKLNDTREVTLDKVGNLVISDGNNARVLNYRIVNTTNNQLAFTYTSDSVCKQ